MKIALALVAATVVVAAAGTAVFSRLRGSDAGGSGTGCAVTVAAGGDLNRAVDEAGADATVCLAAGVHRSFTISRPRAGITIKGAGPETVIRAERKDAVDIVDAERLTFEDLTVRGGDPAGLYATRVRGLTLRNVRVEGAAIDIHLEGGTQAELTDVTLTGSRDFGLLIRRSASVTATRLRVPDRQGIGIGAVDAPGPVTLRESEITRTDKGRGEGIVLNGFERFTLTDVTVRGGDPAAIYVAKARELLVRRVSVDGAVFGLHLDENANATVDDVTLSNSSGVALLLQRGGTVTGTHIRILDTTGTGVSAINGAGQVTLRDSEVTKVAHAGIFAGVAGCDDLPPASLEIPPCFYKDLRAQISTIRVLLERVQVTDTAGPCLVFFPGVNAQVKDSTLTRCELTGLFAWGATADVSNTLFEDNAEHALEYRAYPDPRGEIIAPAAGTIEGSTIHATRALEGAILGAGGPGPVLGGGILAQGARLVLRRNTVDANRDIGIAFINRSSGEVTENRVTANGNVGLCVPPGSTVQVRGNTVSGNRSDNLNACGGLSGGGQ